MKLSSNCIYFMSIFYYIQMQINDIQKSFSTAWKDNIPRVSFALI